MGKRSDALDAIRGLAILLVVAFHWFGLPFGWTGVDLFFVLSGYLIGGILIDSRDSPNYFKTFYARRVFRILPLYWIFLGTIFLTSGMVLPLWRYLTFTQNFAWVHSGLMTAEPTGLTWSLAVEEQFYFVLPMLIRVTPRGALPALSACVIAAAPLFRWLLVITSGEFAPYLLLPGRIDTLFAGVLAACIVRSPTMRETMRHNAPIIWAVSGGAFAGFVALGTMVGFSPVSTPMYLLGYSLVAASYGCGLLAVVTGERREIKHKLICAAGVGAYSIYLCHESVLTAALALPGLSGPGLLVFCVVVTMALAVGSWMLIERPLIRYARTRWRYRAVPPETIIGPTPAVAGKAAIPTPGSSGDG